MVLTKKEKKDIKRRAKAILHTYGDCATRDKNFQMFRAMKYILKTKQVEQ